MSSTGFAMELAGACGKRGGAGLVFVVRFATTK